MPRRSILSASERDSLLALPTERDELIRYYTFSESDFALIGQRRTDTNQLGFAIQLAYMRHPGVMLGVDEVPFPALLRLVSKQLHVPEESWRDYGQRAETRREHRLEIQSVFGFKPFSMQHYRKAVHGLDDLASQTDKGIVLATALIKNLRSELILLPSLNVIERICAEAITRGNSRIYCALTAVLSHAHCKALDALLKLHPAEKISTLTWLRQSPAAPNAKHILEHIERLKVMEGLMLPPDIDHQIHQNRLARSKLKRNTLSPECVHDESLPASLQWRARDDHAAAQPGCQRERHRS